MNITVEDRRALNAMLPISKLYDDVLSLIFMFNAHLDFVHDHPHIPSITIRRSSQVCQRWRDLLLDRPVIWAASLDLGDPKAWIEVVLQRAGDAPLTLVSPSVSRMLGGIAQGSAYRLGIHDLYRWFTEISSDDDFDFALSLLPRCGRITMSVDTKQHLEAIVNRNSFSAMPHFLEELSLYMPYQMHGICILMDSDIAVGLGSNLPQIKILNIDGFWTNFSSPIFQDLTKLHVANPPDNMGLTALGWLEVLRRLPQLEELNLNKCFINGISTPSDTTSSANLPCPVVLPRLQLLALNGICTPCHEILSQLQLPLSCAISVDYGIDTNSTVHYSYSDIMSELCKKIQSSVRCQKITGLSVEASCTRFLVTNMRHFGRDDNFSIALDMEHHNAKMLLELATNLLRIVSPDVDDLYYRFSGFEELPEMATMMLEPFRQVKTLRIDRKDGLLTIASIHQEDGLTSNPQVLPVLSNIYLYLAQIKPPDAADVSAQEIVDLLHHRSQVNAPISNILLKNCYGSEKEPLATKLKDMGVEVEIDDGEMNFPIH